MAFKPHKEFFDASVFLGMRGDDYGGRITQTPFIRTENCRSEAQLIHYPSENTVEKLITGYC